MKIAEKYIPCKVQYLLKWYVVMVALVCALVYIESCHSYPFGDMFWKAILGPTIAFFVVSPLFGLIFTKKSLNTCKFHLPYKYIKNIQVDEFAQKLVITHNYNTCLGLKSKKEHKYEIRAENYKTTLSELIKCFPENITIVR